MFHLGNPRHVGTVNVSGVGEVSMRERGGFLAQVLTNERYLVRVVIMYHY